MPNKAEDVICDNLIHVVCLPFSITLGDDRAVCLSNIAEQLQESAWKEGTAPDIGDSDDVWNDFRRYQARAYFHPFVRRFLYDPNRVRRFHRADVKNIEIHLDHWLTDKDQVHVTVERCELILFQPNIGMLLLEVSPRGSLSLQKTQLLLDAFRRLYPPYVDSFGKPGKPQTWLGGHCPVAVCLFDTLGKQVAHGKFRDIDSHGFMESYKKALLDEPASDQKDRHWRPTYPLAEHWTYLLSPFDCTGTGTGLIAQHLGDDRAPILSWIALNAPCDLDRGNWMRLCFADTPGKDPLPYADKFTKDFEARYCYDRYWYTDGESTDSPSRILNCGYAFSYVGCSLDRDFFTNDKNGAHATFRNIYVEMGLIAHFQKTALLAASQRLSEMVNREAEKVTLPEREEVRDFYDRFVEFTQNFWFDEISPQEQGRELFQSWRGQLSIQKLYDEVRQELKDLVDYTELLATRDLNTKTAELNDATSKLNTQLAFLTKAGILIACLSMIAGVFGINQPETFPYLTYWMFFVSLIVIFLTVKFAKKNGLLSSSHPNRETQ